MSDLPLEGIRIVELTQIYAGPYATMVLSDWGRRSCAWRRCRR